MFNRIFFSKLSLLLLIFAIAFLSTAPIRALAQGSPFRISYRRIESRQTGPGRGINRYRVDWEITGSLPTGVTRFDRFEVCVVEVEGTACSTVGGNARSATVTIEWRDDGIASGRERSLIPYATVKGIALCRSTAVYRGGTISAGAGCIPVNLAPAPQFVRSSGSSQLTQVGVRVEWSVGKLPKGMSLKGFEIDGRVRFKGERPNVPERPSKPGKKGRPEPPGVNTINDEIIKGFEADVGANERSKTFIIDVSILFRQSSSIEQVRVTAVGEIAVSGSSR